MMVFSETDGEMLDWACSSLFEKARKQLDKYNLVLNDNGGKLQLFTKKDWQEADGYPNSISSEIQIDGWINDSCDC